MRLRIIGGVSRDTGVSTRMIRDYGQVGLIRSLRREGSAYRVHGAEDIRRLGRIFGALLILALLKCHMPVRQIECTCDIRMWPPYRCVPALGQRLNAEIEAPSMIRATLRRLMKLIRRSRTCA